MVNVDVEKPACSVLFASFKQQVMIDSVIDSPTHTSRLIGVKMPPRLFPFFNHFADVIVMSNQDAFPFSQLTCHLLYPLALRQYGISTYNYNLNQMNL